MSFIDNQLHKQAELGRDLRVRFLIALGAEVNTVLNDTTPIARASERGHHKVVKTLIKAQANVDRVNNLGNGALILAAKGGHDKVVKTLIKAQANVNSTNGVGISALIYAINNGHNEVVKTLIKGGVDVNFESIRGDYSGSRPIDIAFKDAVVTEDKKQKILISLWENGAIVRSEFFDNNNISEDIKSLAQDALKKSILAGNPIKFLNNSDDEVLLKGLQSKPTEGLNDDDKEKLTKLLSNSIDEKLLSKAFRSITSQDLDDIKKENVIKLKKSGVYPLLKIMNNLSCEEIILTAKNLKDFKVISDKTPFLRNFSNSEKLNENVMPELLASEILMRSFQPNGLGVDLTLKIINEIKALSVSATPYNSGGKRPPLLEPHSSLAPTPPAREEEPSSNPTGCFGWASVVAARIFGSSR